MIGMTGGVGSGKSSVLDCFRERYGAFILEADKVSKSLILSSGSAFEAVTKLLGRDILGPDGEIDKARMAAIIFRDPEKLSAVNAILHPATFKEVEARIHGAEEKLIVYESAIPKEARFTEFCDKILYVYTPRRLRMERLAASRGYSREKCLAIMKNQPTEASYRRLADAVLDNSGPPEETARRLKRILDKWGLREQT